MNRKNVVAKAYAAQIKWAKAVDLVSSECSENIEDHYNASEQDWSYIGVCPTLAHQVGEYAGLSQ